MPDGNRIRGDLLNGTIKTDDGKMVSSIGMTKSELVATWNTQLRQYPSYDLCVTPPFPLGIGVVMCAVYFREGLVFKVNISVGGEGDSERQNYDLVELFKACEIWYEDVFGSSSEMRTPWGRIFLSRPEHGGNIWMIYDR